MLHINIDTSLHEDNYRESGYKSDIFEVFMLQSTPGCNSFAGVQAEHFLEHDTEMLKQSENIDAGYVLHFIYL